MWEKGTAPFFGELVPTEAELTHRQGWSYERASDLLGRIIPEHKAEEAWGKPIAKISKGEIKH